MATSTTELALPPLIPSNVDFQTAYVDFFQIGTVQARTVEAALFTDGFSIWTGGEIIDMTKISGLLLPTDPSDAASKAYVDASVGGNPGGIVSSVQFNDSGTFGGDSLFTWDQTLNILTVGNGLSGKITGISTASITGSTDAANKAYVDAASGNPGGADMDIQFNNLSSFDGSSNLTWNDTTQTMNVIGTINSTNLVGTSISGTTVSGTTVTDWDGISPDYITITGGTLVGTGTTSVTATTISDGSGASMTGDTVTASTFTDNIATLTGGVLSDITDLTFFDDDVTPTTINMGLNAGSTDGLGVISGIKTLTGASSDFDAANKAYVDAAVGSAPGLPASAIQYNSSPAGVFTGDPLFTWNDVTKTMSVTGTITDGTASLSSGALSGVTTISASGVVTLTDATVSTLPTNGALVVTGGVGIGGDVNIVGQVFGADFNATSDIRLKENIVPLENSLDKLADIGCYSYNMIGSDRIAYGCPCSTVGGSWFQGYSSRYSSSQDGKLFAVYSTIDRWYE